MLPDTTDHIIRLSTELSWAWDIYRPSFFARVVSVVTHRASSVSTILVIVIVVVVIIVVVVVVPISLTISFESQYGRQQ